MQLTGPESRGREDGLTTQQVTKGVGAVVAGAAIGAALVYFLHPSKGETRRTEVTRKAQRTLRTLRHSKQMVTIARRLLSARTKAKVASERSGGGNVDGGHEDAISKMLSTVRGELVRLVSHPYAVQALVENGSLILRGSVSEREMDAVLAAIQALGFAVNIENQLATYADPDRGDAAGSRPRDNAGAKPKEKQEQSRPNARGERAADFFVRFAAGLAAQGLEQFVRSQQRERNK